MSSMLSSVIMAINVTKYQKQINEVEKIKVEKQLEKIEKEIAKSVKKMEVMHSDSWWDNNKVWFSMY